MVKKKNNFGTYLLGFLLATLVVGVASKIELPTSNNTSSNKTSENSNLSSSNSSIVIDNYSTIENINYDTCLDKYALDGSTGGVLNSPTYANFWFSDFTIVDSNKTIEFSLEPYKVCYYTNNKTFIKQDKFTTTETITKRYVVPSNAYYIRFQFCTDDSYANPKVLFDNRTSITINYI